MKDSRSVTIECNTIMDVTINETSNQRTSFSQHETEKHEYQKRFNFPKIYINNKLANKFSPREWRVTAGTTCNKIAQLSFGKRVHQRHSWVY